jgi:hypothetical protein
VTRRLKAFGLFCYDFVIGDDWLIAVAVVIGLVVTWLLAVAGVASWWPLPVVVLVALPWSLWRATRRTHAE